MSIPLYLVLFWIIHIFLLVLFILLTCAHCLMSIPTPHLRISQTAGGMQSTRSVHTVAAALTALFLRAAVTRAAASVGKVLWVDTVTCVAVVTRGERPRGLWSAFQLKLFSRDGVGRPARGGVPVGRTGLQQG